MNTLEKITEELRSKGKDDKHIPALIHTASMLAMIEAAYGVINTTTMPTPLYRITFHDDTQAAGQAAASPTATPAPVPITNDFSTGFQILNGRAPVPTHGSLDINMLDMLLAAMFREKMPILLEGKTGVGKTYTVEQFLKTVLPQGSYSMLRLNQNMSNVLQPFTEGRVENGVVRISLRKEELDKIAAMFIDEVNRGDSNLTMQLLDGTVRLSTGEHGDIGILIPYYENGNWKTDPSRRKLTFMVSAQNPAITKDAKYSATRRTDAAQNNRNLQIDVPNSQYQDFLAKNLDINRAALDSLNQDWLSLYAFSTDPSRTYSSMMLSGVEFIDCMIGLVSPRIKEEFEHDLQVINDWNDRLKGYKIDFSTDIKLDDTSKEMQKVKEIVDSFEEEVVTRDTTKVKKLSDALSFIRRTKKAFESENPLETYARIPAHITIQDVSAAFAIMLYDKQENHQVDPVALIDTVMKEYVELVSAYSTEVDPGGRFSPNDPNKSIYNLTFQHALNAVAKRDPQLGALETFVKDIGASVAVLKRKQGGHEYRAPMIARMIADLTTLVGFADQYKEELTPVLELAQYDTQKRRAVTSQARMGFLKLYDKKKSSIAIPDIYIHRLTRVLGY